MDRRSTLSPNSARAMVMKAVEEEIAAFVPRNNTGAGPHVAATEYFRAEVEDHWRYSQASTVASGSIEVQRMLLARALLAAS